MKIYFAGSIRAGRQDRELYLQIIQLLSKYGKVLTEHVGSQSLTETGEKHLSEDEIFERDLSWLTESDNVVAEVTTPSLGVGYEVAKAESLGKPVLCIHRNSDSKKLSSMILGNKKLKIKHYENLEDLKKIFDSVFKTV